MILCVIKFFLSFLLCFSLSQITVATFCHYFPFHSQMIPNDCILSNRDTPGMKFSSLSLSLDFFLLFRLLSFVSFVFKVNKLVKMFATFSGQFSILLPQKTLPSFSLLLFRSLSFSLYETTVFGDNE